VAIRSIKALYKCNPFTIYYCKTTQCRHVLCEYEYIQ